MLTLTATSSRKDQEKYVKELNNVSQKLLKDLEKANALCKRTNYFVPGQKKVLLEVVNKLEARSESFVRDIKDQFLAKDLAASVDKFKDQLEMSITEIVSRLHCLSKGMMDVAEKGNRVAVMDTASTLLEQEFKTANLSKIRQGLLEKDTRIARANEAMAAMSITCS